MSRGRLAAAGVAVAVVAGAVWLFVGGSTGGRDATACAIEDVERPGAAPLADVVGMVSNFVWDEGADPDTELALLAACGVRTIREDLLWEVIEPEPGTLDWARTDRLMLAAARAEVGVLGILGYSAPWASTDPSGEGDRNFPPRDDAEFAGYAEAVATRYAADSSFWDVEGLSDFRPLIGLEIWNEAWGWWAWAPDPDPVRYAALVRATAAAIKAAAPDTVTVLTADPFRNQQAPGDDRWFEAVLDADPSLPELIDVYAVHPYPEPRDVGPLAVRDDVRTDFRRVEVTADLARARGVERPIWITEIGWSTSDDRGAVSESQQARNLIDAIQRVDDEWPFVERVFLYTWARDRADVEGIEGGFGLRRADTSAKPALGALIRLLAGSDGP